MQFDEAVTYLLSLGHETLAIKLGLANIERLLAALDDPQTAYTSVQIAGTNGKGSTAAMLDAICRAAGLRAGLYTSPHLISLTERIRLEGGEIAPQDFARLTEEVRCASLQLQNEIGALPTFFEQVTAVALLAFREARVSLAILETGLGGRLDATTAARADIVAITPVAFDHQEYLGHTLTEIATEKAAIIRPSTCAIVAPQAPAALAAILSRCRASDVTPRFATRDAQVLDSSGDGRLRVTFRTVQDVYADVRLSLRGRHQITNAAVAIALAETLREARGLNISRAAIIEGLETARHAGRLELVAGAPSMLFDGAHNAAGARALRDYLDEFVSAPITLVFGAMGDKELDKIAATLFPVAQRIILTQPPNARAATVEMLQRFVPTEVEARRITLAPRPEEALRLARQQTGPDEIICVTGSLYLVGEIEQMLAGEHI